MGGKLDNIVSFVGATKWNQNVLWIRFMSRIKEAGNLPLNTIRSHKFRKKRMPNVTSKQDIAAYISSIIAAKTLKRSAFWVLCLIIDFIIPWERHNNAVNFLEEELIIRPRAHNHIHTYACWRQLTSVRIL